MPSGVFLNYRSDYVEVFISSPFRTVNKLFDVQNVIQSVFEFGFSHPVFPFFGVVFGLGRLKLLHYLIQTILIISQKPIGGKQLCFQASLPHLIGNRGSF